MVHSNQNMQSKISALFSSGLNNKLGVFVCIALAISLFLPVAGVSFGSMHNAAAMVSGGTGKFVFILTLVSTLFFYGGASRIYVRLLSSAIVVISIFLYYDLILGISQANSFGGGGFARANVGWGLFVNGVALIALLFASYIAKYTEREEVI